MFQFDVAIKISCRSARSPKGTDPKRKFRAFSMPKTRQILKFNNPLITFVSFVDLMKYVGLLKQFTFFFQIYWIGPNVGAVLACGIYIFLFAHEEQKDEEGTELEEVGEMITNKV